MDYKTTRQWSTDTQTVEDEQDVYALVRAIGTSSSEDANVRSFEMMRTCLLEIKKNEESIKHFLSGNPTVDYQTALHMACSMFYLEKPIEKKVVELFVKEFPDLILSNREDSDMYKGQTPLHMAICRGNMWLLNTLLEALSGHDLEDKKVACLQEHATGHKFKNTVMLAELPLSIAALTCNKEVFEKLIQHGAKVDAVNSRLESIYHCFIAYAYLYPDKMDSILDMMKYIHEESKVDDKSKKRLMLMDKMGRETPLQMAARYGQHRIFGFILENAYCYMSNQDGLFDIKMYDITDIDPYLSSSLQQEIHWSRAGNVKDVDSTDSPTKTSSASSPEKIFSKTVSVFDAMFELNYTTAFEFLHRDPIRRLILKKWEYYRLIFYPFWLFHTLFMILLTAYAVERATPMSDRVGRGEIENGTNSTINGGIWRLNEKLDSAFQAIIAILSLFVAFIYLIQEVMRIINRRMPFNMSQLLNPYANGCFRSSLVLFSICLIVDFGATWSPWYEDYLLILAIIIGWLWILFFVRALRRLSFFTSLVQRVLAGDISRFAIIIIFELLAFNTAIYMLLQGPPAHNEESFKSWWRTLVLTLQVFLGILDIPVFDAKSPIVLSLVYVIFLIITTILMLNALIAVMSNTCTELLSNFRDVKEMHLRLQQLSVILFFESMLPIKIAEKLACKVAKRDKIFCFDLINDTERNMTRYLIQVDSIRNAENVSYVESSEQESDHVPNFARIFGTKTESCPKFASMPANGDDMNTFTSEFANKLDNDRRQLVKFDNKSENLQGNMFAMSSLSSFSQFQSEESSSTVSQTTRVVQSQAIKTRKIYFQGIRSNTSDI
ncbi:hypothetical protein CHS0354_037665 [Potamilus streckersoni]|uniref:Ion transport domain-containing protein n=1 Tax=Potamilus streckersoni TaxID=2493646 RepID=A0AAE0W8R4_9BIVA|nr:hypothetical protein CHS0354_037665 [Potamilus streckersoni]